MGKGLKQFLTDEVVGKGKGKESLIVVDTHLGMHICFLKIAQLLNYVWRGSPFNIQKA